MRGGSRLVGEGKLIREGRASASRRQAGAIKEGSRFLPSRRVLCRAIKAGAVKGVCHQRRVPSKLCAIQGAFGILLSRQVSSKWILCRALKSAAGS